jgi:hypothetical protein
MSPRWMDTCAATEPASSSESTRSSSLAATLGRTESSGAADVDGVAFESSRWMSSSSRDVDDEAAELSEACEATA